MTDELLAEIKARYERMCNWGPDTAGMAHACAISYSLDVPLLIAEVERLRAEMEER